MRRGLRHAWAVVTGIFLALALAGAADAKDDDAEHKFVLEFGTAGEWPLTNAPGNFGGTAAVEFEPIENWLELEVRIWIGDAHNGVQNVKSEVLLKIWEMFREAGIRVPYPQRDVRVAGADRLGASPPPATS